MPAADRKGLLSIKSSWLTSARRVTAALLNASDLTINPLLPAEHAERIVVKADRVKYWLGVGAQPTERVAKLLSKMGLCAAPVINERPQKSAPKAKAQARAKAKAEAAAAAAEAAAAPAEAAEPAEA